MRFVGIAVVLLSFFAFLGLLRSRPHSRALTLGLLGFMLFFGEEYRFDANIFSWPLWTGTAKGILISPVDTLCLALLMTRAGPTPKLLFVPVIAIYGFFLAFSVLMSTVPVASLFSCWQFARGALLFVTIGTECARAASRDTFLKGLAFGLIFQSGFVVTQKLGGVVQASGTMYHQNTLGAMTALALMPLLATLLAGNRSKWIALGVVAGLIVLAGGGSRGSLAIGGAGLAALLLLSLAKNVTTTKARVAALAALALAAAGPFALLTLKDRFGESSLTKLDEQRPAFEKAARAMVADYPFGVGANMYVTVSNTEGYAAKAGVAWNRYNRAAPVHNAYLLARSELGWLGEFAFIALLVVPLVRGIVFAFSDRRSTAGEVALGASVALAMNLVHNNYEFVTHTGLVISVLMGNLGLISSQIIAARADRARPRQAPPPDAGARALATPHTRPNPGAAVYQRSR
jgi:O-antigen ligase